MRDGRDSFFLPEATPVVDEWLSPDRQLFARDVRVNILKCRSQITVLVEFERVANQQKLGIDRRSRLCGDICNQRPVVAANLFPGMPRQPSQRPLQLAGLRILVVHFPAIEHPHKRAFAARHRMVVLFQFHVPVQQSLRQLCTDF